MKIALMAGLACAALVSVPAVAQTVETQTTVVKRTTAPSTAVVTGSDASTHVVEIPGEVRTYVTTHDVPVVTYGKPIVVGKTVDGDVVWLDVPSYPKYRWAYVDGHRVVIDADTKDVVAVY